MKKYISTLAFRKIGTLILALTTLTSCFDDFLHVKPVSDITSENFWTSGDAVRTALNSVYADIQKAYSSNSGANYMAWYEARSDNFFGIAKANQMPLLEVSLNKLNSGMVVCDWNLFYEGISRCNYAIHFLPTIENISQSEFKALNAEAHGLRAFLYFTLLKIWGSVPVITKPTLLLSDVTYPVRDSREKVLQQALDDIDIAVRDADINQTDVYLLNSGAIYALGTHIYLWAGKNQEAIDVATKLEAMRRYELVPISSFLNIFSLSNTKENIWSLKWSYANNGANFIIQSMCVTDAQLRISEPLRALWQEQPYRSNDMRRACTIDTTLRAPLANNHLSAPPTRIGTWKFYNGAFGGTGNENPWVMLRLADIILLKAEAYNKLDDQEMAVKELNRVRTRAGLPAYDFIENFASAPNPQKAVLDAILLERRFELVGEGHRYFDLMRNNILKETLNAYYESYYKVKSAYEYRLYGDDYLMYFPVSKDNVIENENLIQEGNY